MPEYSKGEIRAKRLFLFVLIFIVLFLLLDLSLTKVEFCSSNFCKIVPVMELVPSLG